MRAARRAAQATGSRATGDAGARDMHISGAEGIYPKNLVRKTVQEYIDRAQTHPKGSPDSICITVERIRRTPRKIASLAVVTLTAGSPSRAHACVRKLLSAAGVSSRAQDVAFSVLQGSTVMRGAALVLARSGKRVESDRERGVRASRFGIIPAAERTLSSELSGCGINTQTVREALMLASKVTSHAAIVAELCISDDPDYTTGYLASHALGYIRVPAMKERSSPAGGRVFFLEDTADVPSVIRYLERTPVLVTAIRPCSGKASLREILDRHYQ